MSAGTCGCDVKNLRNSVNASVFFLCRGAWVRLQNILFLKISDSEIVLGAFGAVYSGRDLAHVLISATLWHAAGAVFVVNFVK